MLGRAALGDEASVDEVVGGEAFLGGALGSKAVEEEVFLGPAFVKESLGDSLASIGDVSVGKLLDGEG